MTQSERISNYIMEHGSITPFEATLELGIIDLARSVSYMRQNGYTNIIGTPEKARNRYGEPVRYYRYSFKEENEDDK